MWTTHDDIVSTEITHGLEQDPDSVIVSLLVS